MAHEDSPVIANMRARAEQCRRLAAALTDNRAAAVLIKMAEEVEVDIGRLEGPVGSSDIPKPLSQTPE